MKQLIVILLLAGLAPAESRVHKLYRWSVAALVAGSAADLVTSYGLTESNPVPVLGSGHFGARQTGFKIGITAGVLVMQYYRVRHHPEREKSLVWTNFIVAGGYAGVAIHNQLLKQQH